MPHLEPLFEEVLDASIGFVTEALAGFVFLELELSTSIFSMGASVSDIMLMIRNNNIYFRLVVLS